MFNGKVIEIIQTSSDKFKVPTSLLEASIQGIQRDVVKGFMTLEYRFTPRDLIHMRNGEYQVQKISPAHERVKVAFDPELGHYDGSVLYMTQMRVEGWRHDSPFFLEVGTPYTQKYLHLLEAVAKGSVSPAALKNEACSTLRCPAIFYTQLKAPTNIIEEEIFADPDNRVLNEETSYMFGEAAPVTQMVSEFSFLSEGSITGPVAEVGSRAKRYVYTPMTSLVGLVARRMGRKYPLVWNGTDFQGQDNYLLKLPVNIYEECLSVIKERHTTVDMHSKFRLTDVPFTVKASSMFTQWNLDESTKAFLYDRNKDDPACDIPLDEMFTLTLRVYVEAVALNPHGHNRYAMDTGSMGVFFFPPYPMNAVDKDGKILSVTDEHGNIVYEEDAQGRRVPKKREPFNIPTILGPNKGNDVEQLGEDYDRRNTRRTTAKRSSHASSSSSSSLCDD